MRELASVKREGVEIPPPPFFNSEVLFKNMNNDNLLNVYKIFVEVTDNNGNIFNCDVLKICFV